MRIFVVGASGWIGLAVVPELIAAARANGVSGYITEPQPATEPRDDAT
jgi:nucleoside-diphosphate-sugar epimerase